MAQVYVIMLTRCLSINTINNLNVSAVVTNYCITDNHKVAKYPLLNRRWNN